MKLRSLTIAALVATAVAVPGINLLASSHREAPFITEMPKVDGTDFYMFRSYEPGNEGDGYVTIIANYHPLQDAYGGPNYFSMDPDALYEIHIDNNADAKEDLTFQFRFTNTLKDAKVKFENVDDGTGKLVTKEISTPLINFHPTNKPDGIPKGLNVEETYKVTLVRGPRRGGTRVPLVNPKDGTQTFTKPVDYIGTKTIADYDTYAAQYRYENINIPIPGCSMPGKMFVGQRKEPFVVNLGETFDLINTDPLGPENGEANTIANKNITSFILEIHKSCLIAGDPVIGGWTTASVRQARLLRRVPSYEKPSLEGGPWVQVSRLGMPLVNEVVIGLKDKDRFNSSEPKDDTQFLDYVLYPTLPALIQTLFPVAKAPTKFPRNDLVVAFLTGVPGLNKPTAVQPSEVLRLNTSIDAKPRGQQSRLGVLKSASTGFPDGDAAGFPNGRRPGDDVVDIELRVAMGYLCTLTAMAPGPMDPPNPFGCIAADAPVGGAAITDGAFIDDSDTYFNATFPYLKTPTRGSPN